MKCIAWGLAVLTVVLLAASMGGCAMDMEDIVQIPPETLCIDQAQVVLTGHEMRPDGHETLTLDQINAALATDGMNCTPNERYYMKLASARMQAQNEQQPNHSAAWFAAAAILLRNNQSHTAGNVSTTSCTPGYRGDINCTTTH